MNSKKKSIGLLVTPIVAVALFIVIIFTCVVQVFGKDNNMSFAQYKADYYIDSASYKYYMSDNFTLPYRTIVEHNRKSPVYQGLINSWQVATFNLSNVVDFSKKRVGYYEAFLFDILYKGNDPTNISGVLNSGIKATQSSMLKKVADFGSQEYKSFAKDKLSTMTDDELNNLVNGLNDCYEFKQVFGTISDIGKYAQYATDVEDLIYKFSKIVVLSKLSYEYSEVLNYVSDNTTDNSLKVACNELSAICSNAVDNSTIMTILAGDYAATQIGKYLLDEIWDGVIKKLNIYGIAIKTGQAVGKWASSLFFSTDKEIETYYEMNTLYDFEDQLKKAVNHYASKVNSSNTEENAKLFNASYEMLISTFALGCDISVKYSSVTYDSGVVNLFISNVSGNHDKFEKYKETLNNLKKNIEFESNFANNQLYNLYLQDYCQDTSEIINAQPVTIPADAKSTDQYVSEIQKDVFLTCDIHINKDTTLTDNMETYGDLYFDGGTLDLIGHKCTIQGNLYQSGGKMYIDGGKLEVTGDYRIQSYEKNNTTDEMWYTKSSGYIEMSHDSDLVKVKGSFYTQSTMGNGDNILTTGTMEIGGDFSQFEGSKYNFACRGTHKVILNGTEKQNVYFDSTSSKFNILKLTKDKEKDYTFDPDNCWSELYLNTNVKSVSIISPKTMKQCDSTKLLVKVIGINKPSQSVNWKISGNTDENTTINDKGVLTIGLNEKAEKITIIATSVADNTKSASVDITIYPVESVVDGINVTPSVVSTVCGGKIQFSSHIYGTYNPSQEVIWSLSGNNSTSTQIDSNGLLTIGNDETSKTITVQATSKLDNTKFTTVKVDVLQIKIISTVDNVTVTMETGETKQLKAMVSGTNNPSQNVTWSLSGNNSEKTVITSDGLLTIGKDETSKKIVVKAKSVEDPSKYGEFAINIESTTPNYDVNMDGVVDIKDASLIQKYLTDLASLTDEQMSLADINQDGLVNIKDVTYLQRYLTKVN